MSREPNENPAFSAAAQHGLWEFLGIVTKNWWVIALLFVLGAAGAGFYSYGQTKIYQAQITVQIDPSPPKPLGQEVQSVVDVGTGYVNNRDYYKTQYDILKSRTLALKTVQRLGLQRDDSFIQNLPIGSATTDLELTDRERLERARQELQKRMTVSPVRESRLVEVFFEDAEPERAERILRTLVDIYIDDNVDSVLASTSIAAEWLDEQRQKLKNELSDNELALHEYKKENQIQAVSMEDQNNMLRDEMHQLNQALTMVRTQLQTLQARYEQLQQVNVTDPTELPAKELLDSEVLKALRADYIRAKQQRQSLLGAGKGEKHPEVLAAASVEKISRQALLAEVDNIREALRRDIAGKRQEENGLRGLFSRAKTQALELSRLSLKYRRLERSKNNTEKLYDLVQERSKESDLTRHMRFNNIRVIDDALASRLAVKPRTPLNVAVGGVFGLFLGFFAAFGRNALDRTFKGGEDVETHLGLTMLGVLPLTSNPGRRARRGRRAILGDELVIHRKPNSSAAEAARALRTNLMFTSPDNPQQLLMITSGGPLEGKTTVACWVATAMAQAGNKVLLVDCDLRRPRLHKIFGRTNDRGVSTYLLEEGSMDDDDLSTEVPQLDVITAGPSVPNPAELLQSERFSHLLAKWRKRYDRIVLDTPPVNAVTDAAVLSTKVDGVLLVVRAHNTTRDSAKHSVKALVDVSDKLLGVVLNAHDERRAGYGYGYGAYRYQYYYGNRPDHESEASETKT